MQDFNDEFYLKLDHIVHYLQYLKFVNTSDIEYWKKNKEFLLKTLYDQFHQAVATTGILLEPKPIHVLVPEPPVIIQPKHQIFPPLKTNTEKYQTPSYTIKQRLNMLHIKNAEGVLIPIEKLIDNDPFNNTNQCKGSIISGLSKRICNVYKERYKEKPQYKTIQIPLSGTDSYRSVQTPTYPETEYTLWIDHFIVNQGFDLTMQQYRHVSRQTVKDVNKVKRQYSNPKSTFVLEESVTVA